MTNDEDEATKGHDSSVDQHIEQLEETIAALRLAAFSEEPSPD